MEILFFKSARVVVFKTLTEAMASTHILKFGDIAMVKGDPTRVKIGFGSNVSAADPAVITGSTFATLDWFNNGSATSKTPSVTFAQNATGTITAANLLKKYITSTSAAAVALTLPTATLLATALGLSNSVAPIAKGTEFDFTVDNSAGANTVTVVVGSGITVPTAVLTGADTLTIAAGGFGKFKIIFKSATVALLYRVL